MTLNNPPSHILVVDDDPAALKLISRMIEASGYRVTATSNGAAAIEALREQNFDVVLTDLMMPGTNGLDLVRHIRSHHPETCAAIITGFTDRTTFSEVIEAGAEDFICKPINSAELQARIERILLQRDIRHQLNATLDQHRQIQDEARRSLASVSVLNRLLNLAVEKKSLDEILDMFILYITSLPWLGLSPKGAILLAGSEPDVLELKAHRNLAKELITICAKVPFGRCLCGQAAASRKVVFDNHLHDSHHNTFAGIPDHGHYCVPILATDNELLGVFTLYVDAGAVYNEQVEETLKAAAATMAGILIQHRTEEERRRLQDELRQSQKQQAVSTMAKGLAHEFNNMLTTIRGFASLIQEDTEDQAQVKEDAGQILSVTDRGIEVVRKMQAISREEDASHAPVRLAPIVRETLTTLRENPPPGIVIHEQYDAGDSAVIGSVPEIHELVNALVSNACKAMRRQGGKLTVRLDEVILAHKLAGGSTGRLAEGRWLRLTVSDTGTGMTPEIRARIFEPYFSGSSHEDGAGLGLTVTLGIIRAMDGDIVVESTFGRGSTFTVFLPPVSASKPEQTEKTP